ncbi:MAG: ABC transporter permease subunit [Lachnospiraceae bacterium]|nr:ABC transporter permease subunit [Lachnospiraceae bacterium]
MQTLRRNIRKDWMLLLIVLPGVLYFAVFCYGPMYGILMAFKDYNVSKGIWGSPWSGWKHFKELVNSVYFGRLVKNTFLLSIEQLIWSFPVPIAFALLLNELRNNKWKRVAQTAAYLPHFISVVVVVGILKDLLSSDGGVLTQLFMIFGVQPRNYFNMPEAFRTLYVGSGVWQEFGWNSIIYVAAISTIDQEMYESAALDGAGRWKKLIYITLPAIAPTIVLLLVMNMGNMLNIGYEKVILMYNSATYSTADIFSTYVYRKGLLSAQYSFASAVGLANSVINVLILSGANYVAKKAADTSIF